MGQVSTSFTFILHPDGPSYPLPYQPDNGNTWYIGPGDTSSVRYFCFYIPAIIESVTGLTGTITGTNIATNPTWCWDDNLTCDHYSINSNGWPASYNINDLVAHFSDSTHNKKRQLMFCRVRANHPGSGYVHGIVSSIQVTITGTFRTIDNVSIGDKVTRANMKALADYINELSGYLCTGASQSITIPTANNKILLDNWSSYIAKANTLPHVSNLQPPSDTKITAAYYNSIANAVCQVS